mgnify:FL=1
MKKNKLNNKGFMLVEVIIVTVIVATIMTSLYVAFTRVYKVYDMKSRYSNIDGIYALNTIKNYYIENVSMNKLINDTKDKYINIKSNSSYCNTNNYCEKINNIIVNYKINNLYIIDKEKLIDNINEEDTTQTLKDYINYLNDTLDKTDNNNSVKAYLIGEFTISATNEIYNYAYLPIKV